MVKTNPSSVRRVAVYGLAGLQFFFQVTPAFAGVFQADEQSVAQTAMEAGRVLQGSNCGDAAHQLLTSQASGQAADAVTQWLNQFGTAKTQLSVDSDFSLKGSSLDVLLPFYNTPKNVLFTQLGMRDNDGRFTTNAGLGHRYFTDNGWMLGYNVFYDVDWRNTNRRYGIGVEAWRDYPAATTETRVSIIWFTADSGRNPEISHSVRNRLSIVSQRRERTCMVIPAR
ncbi:inverse autotransporter beta domain-containing protein [Escherichia coli]|uniref:inverse autotransporter beta domain-containing protein n=1 Tax=Escherichia coli TaxID=562 RepID=UPI00201CC26C|nr:inverse autotransporter beta domain-containing protein [Escherichia coli]